MPRKGLAGKLGRTRRNARCFFNNRASAEGNPSTGGERHAMVVRLRKAARHVPLPRHREEQADERADGGADRAQEKGGEDTPAAKPKTPPNHAPKFIVPYCSAMNRNMSSLRAASRGFGALDGNVVREETGADSFRGSPGFRQPYSLAYIFLHPGFLYLLHLIDYLSLSPA